MTKPLERARLESLRAELLVILAEADAAEAHVLAIHLSQAIAEVDRVLVD